MKRLIEFTKRKFVRDAVSLQAASGIQMVTYFVTSILTANYLGDFEYGRWAAAREIYAFAYFLVSMGVVNATVTVYSEAVGRQDRRRSVDALAALLKIGALTAAVLIALGFAVAPALARHFYGGDGAVGKLAAVLCIAGVAEILRGFATAALQGSRQMLRYAAFDMASNITRVALIGMVVWADLGIEGMVGAFLAHMFLTAGFALTAYRRAGRGDPKLAPPPIPEVLAAVRGAPVRHIFGLSYLIALNKQMNTLVPRLGLVLIPALATAGFKDNGSYAVASVLAMALSMGLSGVAQTLLPTLGIKMGSQDVPFDKLGGLLRRVSLATGSFMCIATVVSAPVVYWVLNTFYIEEYSDSFRYFLWLASGNLFIGFAVIVDAFYLYSGKIRQVIPVNFVFAALATGGILLGSKLYGPIGTAAASGLCRGFALLHLVYIWLYFRRVRATATTSTTA